jgi:hypothetical protein
MAKRTGPDPLFYDPIYHLSIMVGAEDAYCEALARKDRALQRIGRAIDVVVTCAELGCVLVGLCRKDGRA